MSFVVFDTTSACREGISCQGCGRTIVVPLQFIECLAHPSDGAMFRMYQLRDLAVWLENRSQMMKRYSLCDDCRDGIREDEYTCLYCDNTVVEGTHFCESHICQKRVNGHRCKHARMCDYAMCPEHVHMQMISGRSHGCYAQLFRALEERVKT
jgi:hypothetical protein